MFANEERLARSHVGLENADDMGVTHDDIGLVGKFPTGAKIFRVFN